MYGNTSIGIPTFNRPSSVLFSHETFLKSKNGEGHVFKDHGQARLEGL
jgi:hypothetical protein